MFLSLIITESAHFFQVKGICTFLKNGNYYSPFYPRSLKLQRASESPGEFLKADAGGAGDLKIKVCFSPLPSQQFYSNNNTAQQ